MKQLLLTLLLLVMTVPAKATTWYVAKTGSDSHTCTQAQSASTPKLTINAALECVDPNRHLGGSTAGADDIVEVSAGTYAEVFDQNIVTNPGKQLPGGTSWDHPFTLRAAAGETVNLNPTSGACMDRLGAGPFPCTNMNFWNVAYIIVDRINLIGDNLAYDNVRIDCESDFVNCAHHIRFQDLSMGNTKNNCTLVTGHHNEFLRVNLTACGDRDPTYGGHNAHYWVGDDNLADGGSIHDTSNGPQSWSDVANPSRNVFRNLTVYNIVGALDGSGVAGTGIGLFRGTANKAENNIVYNVNGPGIRIDYQCDECIAINNTVEGSYHATYGSGIGISIFASNSTVRNNISINNVQADIDDQGSATTKSNNLCDSGCNINADPLFTNEAGHDYTLTSSSPARDAGTNTGCPSTDFAGISRPQNSTCDIGAYEFVVASGSGSPFLRGGRVPYFGGRR